MIDSLLPLRELVLLSTVGIGGIVTHELCHYLACRFYGARASFTWIRHHRWDIPNPAVRTSFKDHTPRSIAIVGMAPLVMHLVSLPIVGYYMATNTPVSPSVLGLLVLWHLAGIPSPSDLQNIVNSHKILDFHDVWYGDHATHRYAEGIA